MAYSRAEPAPLVSIIMPVYNAASYLQEAITSILNQSFSNFELLVFNDGSSDGSAELLKQFHDPRLKLFNYSVNTGYVIHLNEGIKIAQGKYIARMDADDVSYPDRLQKQVDYLETHPEVGVCGSQVRYIGDYNGESSMPTTYSEIAIALIAQCPIWHPTVMMRRSILTERNLLYNNDFLFTEDYDLWCKIAKETKIINLSKPLLYYRKHKQQVSVTKIASQIEASNLIGSEYLLSLGFNLSDEQATGLTYLRKNLWQYPIVSSAGEYSSIINTMNEIIKQNDTLKVFNTDELYIQFTLYWQKITEGIPRFNPKFLTPLLFKKKSFANNVSLATYISYTVKSLVFWKTRV